MLGMTVDELGGLMVGATAVAALALLLATPYLVARHRGHPNATAIRVCALCGLLFPPLWLVALVWAFTGPPAPSRPIHHPRPRRAGEGGEWPDIQP